MDNHTIANRLLCTYFSNLGPNFARYIPTVDVSFTGYLPGNYPNSLLLKETLLTEIKSITLSLKNKSSCGFDGISPFSFKNIIITQISKPLSEIITLHRHCTRQIKNGLY